MIRDASVRVKKQKNAKYIWSTSDDFVRKIQLPSYFSPKLRLAIVQCTIASKKMQKFVFLMSQIKGVQVGGDGGGQYLKPQILHEGKDVKLNLFNNILRKTEEF